MGNRTPWLGFDPQQKGGRVHAGLHLQILQGRRQPSPARDCQNKNALRQRGNFILLYVTWGIEHRILDCHATLAMTKVAESNEFI